MLRSGGYKNSGIGCENGPEGIEQYVEHKSVLLPFGYTLAVTARADAGDPARAVRGRSVCSPEVSGLFGWPTVKPACLRDDPGVPCKPLTAPGEIPTPEFQAIFASTLTIAEQYDWHQSHLRRHRVSRRNFLRGSAAATAAAALGVSPFGRRAYAADAPLTVANRHVGFGTDASSQLRLGAQLSREAPATQRFSSTSALRPGLARPSKQIRNLLTQIPDSKAAAYWPPNSSTPTLRYTACPGAPVFYRWRTRDGSPATPRRHGPRCRAYARNRRRSASP